MMQAAREIKSHQITSLPRIHRHEIRRGVHEIRDERILVCVSPIHRTFRDLEVRRQETRLDVDRPGQFLAAHTAALGLRIVMEGRAAPRLGDRQQSRLAFR